MNKERVDLFDSVNPIAVKQYLLDNNWQAEQTIPNRQIILANYKEARKFTIMLPLDKDIPDFSNRIYEVFKTLEAFEQRQIKMLTDFCQ